MSRRADGCLIDLDGTVYRVRPGGEEAIPGAREALEALRRAGVPFRFATNTTRKPRRAIVQGLREIGVEAEIDEVLTAPTAAAGWLRRQGARRVAALLAPATREELEELSGIEVLAPDAPGTDPEEGGAAEYLVVGDLGKAWAYANLNWGFRQLMAGARLVAVQRNRFWETGEGLGLDAGAFVAALEYATGQEAEVVGKPSRAFFESGAASLGLEPARCVMVGDDLDADAVGARAAGLQGVLVRTGKLRPDDEAAARAASDAILDGLADLPAWLGLG